MQERLSAKEREEKVLAEWEANRIFERSVEERPSDKSYVFFDGPPFATGLPHYGHIVASTMKDVVPRFWTMRGRRVERVWGWDCHGLPIENIVEKELDLGTRQRIEAFGVKEFNDACRSKVLEYAKEWKVVMRRLGRFVDMEHAYHTMDKSYMESVWWVFKSLHDKGMLYEGFRPIHICPRCATTLSASEVGQNYTDLTDIAVTLKFGDAGEPGTSFLAWTTTPWTLPGNMLLAVNPELDYIRVSQNGEKYILAESRKEMLDGQFEVIEKIKGSVLVGKKYEPLFPYFKDRAGAFRVVAADFVATDEGTGIVHIAPGFGEEDFEVGKREGLELIRHITIDGTFTGEVSDFAGKRARESDTKIIEWLAGKGRVYKTAPITHSYPLCWRCDTPLLNFATASWFVSVSKIRDELLKNNESIHWVPENMKHGRFGAWLEGARDWSVSRNRYWGTPLPVWKSEDGELLVLGSIEELEEASGKKVEDLHKQFVDNLILAKNGKTFRRIPEVLDCWFESGSMPYAQIHYPFENRERFMAGFPAEFIAEGQDQTRGWFYTLHVLSTILFNGPAFKNVIVNGIVLAEDGRKMAKKLKNYPDTMEVIDRYGADAVRLYLMSSSVVRAENLHFSEAGVKEISNKLLGTLENVLSFYKLFVREKPALSDGKSSAVLDKWVMARLAKTVSAVTDAMEGYELSSAAREIQEFVTDLSQWYIRRSRERFRGEDLNDKNAASRTLYETLETVSKIIAPFAPFMAEHIWKEIGAEGDSVHLSKWPEATVIDCGVLQDMEEVRALVSLALDERMKANISVRQTLNKLTVKTRANISDDYLDIIKDEVNVLEVASADGERAVELDTALSPELLRLGLLRELIRQTNDLRKRAGLTVGDIITLHIAGGEEVIRTIEEHEKELIRKTGAKAIVRSLDGASKTGEIEAGGGKIQIGISTL
ncbi:MAG: isoleucine--tRNA ligase [Patescibacteria group bacterium]